MKRLNFIVAFLSLAFVAVAVSGDEKDGKKDVEPAVKMQIHSRVITIGPNGEAQIQELGDGMEGLPEGIKKHLGGKIRGIVEGMATAEGGEEEGGASDVKSRVFSMEKVFKIGSDGKVQEVGGADGIPKDILERIKKATEGSASMHGSITVVGPDGKKHTSSLGDTSDADSISKAIEQALKGVGTELPKEVQSTLREALKEMPRALKIQMDTSPRRETDSISQKLDKILKRLDKLEKEVAELKKNL